MSRPLLIEPGQRFGYWTIIQETRSAAVPSVPTGQRAAVCRCDCGTERTIVLSVLAAGKKTRLCGCRKGQHSSASLSRITVKPGQRFSRLVVIRETRLPVPSRPGKSVRAAVCQCDCGNESTTTLSLLAGGHTRSCGCLNREMAAERLRAAALAGRKLHVREGGRFGRLKVIDPDVRFQTKDRTVPGVQVRCDCGTVKIVSISHLIAGDIKSCGCVRAQGGALRKWLADPANAAQIAATRAAATAAAREYARSPENLAKLRTMLAKRWEGHIRKPRSSRSNGEPRRWTPPSRGPFAPKHGLAKHPLYGTWRTCLIAARTPRRSATRTTVAGASRSARSGMT